MTDTNPGNSDPRLDALIAELTERVRAGAIIDAEREAARLPEHANQVRRAIATLGLLALAAAGSTTHGEPPDGTAASPPDRLGEFVLLGVLGRGGMGVVYEADQPSLRRRVALKTLPVGAALDPARLRRFELEAQVIGGLRHPHIVPVYAVGSDRGIPYFTMPRIEGESLDRLIDALRHPEGNTGPGPKTSSLDAILALEPGAAPATTAKELPPTAPVPRAPNESTPGPAAIRRRDYIRGVARLAGQAADALAHAHAQGVVHRDIKPGNLMLDAAGHLWITDFGLARLRDAAPLTESGQRLGTLRYASPEQLRGGEANIDGRADVYSLGVTLYELLTLRPAVPGATTRPPSCAMSSRPSPPGHAASTRRSPATWRQSSLKPPPRSQTSATLPPPSLPTTSAASSTRARSAPAGPACSTPPPSGPDGTRPWSPSPPRRWSCWPPDSAPPPGSSPPSATRPCATRAAPSAASASPSTPSPCSATPS